MYDWFFSCVCMCMSIDASVLVHVCGCCIVCMWCIHRASDYCVHEPVSILIPCSHAHTHTHTHTQVPENPPNYKYYRQMSKVLHSSGRGLLQSVIGLVSSQVHHSIWTACHSLDMCMRTGMGKVILGLGTRAFVRC